MKKRMLILALAGLVAGSCASNRGTGGTANQNEMNSSFGQGFENPYNPDVNAVGDPAEQQP